MGKHYFRRAMLSSDSSCFLTKHLKNLDPSYKTNLDLWDYQFSESLDLLNTLHICYRHFEDVHEAVWCPKFFWQVDRVLNLLCHFPFQCTYWIMIDSAYLMKSTSPRAFIQLNHNKGSKSVPLLMKNQLSYTPFILLPQVYIASHTTFPKKFRYTIVTVHFLYNFQVIN